jgi:aquaporin NIP
MRRYLAELIGTYALVFCGTGAIIINEQSGGVITHVGVACTFGLVVMSMIYTFGDISGAHINPAVSMAFTVAGRFPLKMLPFYIVSQLSGAILASLTLKGLFPGALNLGSTLPAGSQYQSLMLEFILSFFLMLVIINVSTGSKEQGMFAGLAIGSVVGLEAMFAGPICGASMNTARSIGPAIVSGHFSSLWIYVLAPVAGAFTAVPVFNILKPEPKDPKHGNL